MIEVSRLYHNGTSIRNVRLEEAVDALASEERGFIWVGVKDPDNSCIKNLESAFQLHEMLIEDALESRQHPKVERYENYAFLSLNTAKINQGIIHFGELKIIVFKNGLISIDQNAQLNYGIIERRCERLSSLKKLSINLIVYHLIDQIVDHLVEVTSDVNRVFGELEKQFITQKTLKDNQTFELYLLRRKLLKIQSVVIPLVENTRRLQNSDSEYINKKNNKKSHPYFRDLYFNSAQVNNDIYNLIEAISYAFEAASIISDSRENMIQKKLGSWAAILAVPAIIGSFYGMNFEVMPELNWKYGYYVVIGFSVIICVSLYLRFRRDDWL